jgi:H+-transporting ATPase
MTPDARSNVPEPSVATVTPIGFTSAEARRRLAEFGPNAVPEDTPQPWRTFLTKFWSPIPWMLEGACLLQLGLHAYVEATVIGALLVVNATLGFLQERRAGAALAALTQRLAPNASIRRDDAWVRRPASDVVPGDVIRLSLGAVIPADARVISGAVTVDQSMLTGESVPVDAESGGQVYAGALVRRGEATAEVTATGSRTYFGRAAELVRVAHAASTEQTAIWGVTRNLAIVNGAVAVLLLVYAHVAGLPATDLVRLGLTALLASIPVALPATFTLSAAVSAQTQARHGVLLTRLSAAHEAAGMDVLCADKTGTLTHNRLTVRAIAPMPGFDGARVLALAALASSDSDQDAIDVAIRHAVGAGSTVTAERLVRFVPFDPATRIAEAIVIDPDGRELHIAKGAFHAIMDLAEVPANARHLVDDLAAHGSRVIAVVAGPPHALRLAGLIALDDPPREDSAPLIASLRDMGVRTVMVTGDSSATAEAIARLVGIGGATCAADHLSDKHVADACGIFARVLPEDKYQLVKALQRDGHVVGMCGDGANDAPALRQAQIGIAVSMATDVAKAAASMVLTEPGLAGIVVAVREGRIAFQRVLTYTLNMLVKKIEIVLFLAIGLGLTGHAVLTPVLMVLMMMTNDILSMSLTTDRASSSASPSRWRMRNVTFAGVVLGVCKLAFSTAVLVWGIFRFGLGPGASQTLAFITLVFGNQALLYVLRERRPFWSSRPSAWVMASSAADVAIVSTLVLSGVLMEPLPWRLVVAVLASAAGFAFILDQIKRPVTAMFEMT